LVVREIVLFIGSLAGAAVLTSLAVLVKPESPLWTWILWIGAAVFLVCAILLLFDIVRGLPRKKIVSAIPRSGPNVSIVGGKSGRNQGHGIWIGRGNIDAQLIGTNTSGNKGDGIHISDSLTPEDEDKGKK
jgi:MFS family permease